MIQAIINEINQIITDMLAAGVMDTKALAVAIEANQRYLEYLDELETKINILENGESENHG